MTDVIALLAISQLITLSALFYLYLQVQELRRGLRPVRRAAAPPAPAPGIPVRGAAARRAAGAAYAATPRPALDQLRHGAAVDVAELARRMHRSEEEVRLLLRRQGIAS
jgi:hypothetical protein